MARETSFPPGAVMASPPVLFNYPFAIAVDSTGSQVYVADSGNNRVQKFSYIPPVITAQSGSSTNLVGANIALNVSVTGSTAFGYRWEKDGVLLSCGSSTLTLTNVVVGDSGVYPGDRYEHLRIRHQFPDEPDNHRSAANPGPAGWRGQNRRGSPLLSAWWRMEQPPLSYQWRKKRRQPAQRHQYRSKSHKPDALGYRELFGVRKQYGQAPQTAGTRSSTSACCRLPRSFDRGCLS